MTAATGHDERESFYWAGGQRVPLYRDPRVFAVRFRPGARADGPLSRRAARLLREESTNVTQIPGYGLQVFASDPRVGRRADPEAQQAERLREVRALVEEPAVEYASPAFRRSPSDPDVMFVRPRIIVEFVPEATRPQIDELNAQLGGTIVERLGYVENGYVLEAPEADGERGAIQLAARYYESSLVRSATPDLIRRRHVKQAATTETIARTEPSTTAARASRSMFLPEQWHLRTAKVVNAWNLTTGDPVIAVAVLDDGVDVDHAEFAGKVTVEHDFENHVADGRPKLASDAHGTACAGVAVASGVKASGAAPDCSLIAVRTPSFLGIDDEARMFEWTADNDADVISCSWGPADGTGATDPLPDPTRAAIHYCLTNGRGGKGIPIFWAAGNGDESVSLDGYAANPEVIAVAASTSDETRSWYSDFGPEVDICAPSSGDLSAGELEIFTTDRRGVDGYNSGDANLGDPAGDYTNDFGGTSSATPLAAGVAGLILSANPALTALEVKEVLELTADKIGDASGYDASGHSDEFGYGRINALKAVQEALRRAPGGAAAGAGAGAAAGADTVGASVADGPSIRTARRISRSDPPPTFEIDRAGRSHYAVEVATASELFDTSAHEADRVQSRFHPAWQAGESDVRTSVPYRLPDHVWSRLESTARLFFRVHVTDDPSTWTNYAVTTPDSRAASAPAIEITMAGPSDEGTAPATDAATTRTVRYPSGATFDEVLEPQDGVDYSDPVANGLVPLIELEGRLDTALSTNFKLREFAARQLGGHGTVRYARVSPELVERLQGLREHVGAAIRVISGYRYPALNGDVDGASRSQHMAGRAADISSSGTTPLELARAALESMGFDIGIGLGRSSIHVDVRGELATWTYEGSELDEAEFDAWVRDLERTGGRSMRLRREVAEQVRPRISSVGRWPRAEESPVFTVWPGGDRRYVVQAATDWRLFDSERFGVALSAETFFSTEEDGLLDSGGSFQLTLPMPADAWRRLRTAERLFYRLLTVPKHAVESAVVDASTHDEDAADAPSIELFDPAQARDTIGLVRSEAAQRARDEQLWRST
jgi:subtilisin family serine protease